MSFKLLASNLQYISQDNNLDIRIIKSYEYVYMRKNVCIYINKHVHTKHDI